MECRRPIATNRPSYEAAIVTVAAAAGAAMSAKRWNDGHAESSVNRGRAQKAAANTIAIAHGFSGPGQS